MEKIRDKGKINIRFRSVLMQVEFKTQGSKVEFVSSKNSGRDITNIIMADKQMRTELEQAISEKINKAN